MDTPTDVNTPVVLNGHSDDVNAVAYSRDGKMIATASWDKTVRIWDGRSGQFLRLLEGHEQPVRAVTFAPDSRRLLTAVTPEAAAKLPPVDKAVLFKQFLKNLAATHGNPRLDPELCCGAGRADRDIGKLF